MTANTNLEPPKVSPLWLILALGVFILMLATLESCNSAARLERRQLAPYKSVLADVDTNCIDKKNDLLEAIVNAKMPNKSKKETITKYIQGRNIIVKDTSGNKRLRDYYERQYEGKLCFTGEQIDSMVNAAIDEIEPTIIYRTDTLDNSTNETIIDTTGNREKQKAIDKGKLAELNLIAANEQIEAFKTNEKNGGYLLKLLFFKYWWIVLLLCVGGGLFTYLKLRSQYLSKIVK
jgi:hypothetical protein